MIQPFLMTAKMFEATIQFASAYLRHEEMRMYVSQGDDDYLVESIKAVDGKYEVKCIDHIDSSEAPPTITLMLPANHTVWGFWQEQDQNEKFGFKNIQY